MIAKSHRWRQTAMVAALCGLWGLNAMALSLGRITVQSALGEPLRAEVDVPDINAEEAASLKASVALPEAFKAAGLEYNPAMASLQATLQRRSDGRAYIRLSGDRAINDPFVDLVLEARWGSGRIVRDYTLLFDPPNARPAAAVAATPAQVAAPASPSRTPVARSAAPAAPASTTAQATAPGKVAAQTPVRPAIVNTLNGGAGQVIVKAGDTASRIAAATKSEKVSLDQMLVALLRTNPTAFMGDNINRVKAGAIMNIPTAEQAAATPQSEATQIIVAQSKDFNAFRRKLAANAAIIPKAATDRSTSGSVQASVDDSKPVTAAPDKLTLSKGGIQKLPAEDKLVKDRSAREAASRVAEISKNISELSSLGAASNAVAANPVASPASATQPGATTVTSAIPKPTPADPPALAASAAGQIPAAAVASAPLRVASSTPKRPPVVPAPAPEAGLLDGLIESPLVPTGAVGLIALLVFFGLYRSRQRKNSDPVDSVFLENRIRPDSFFGASGGQSVDTHDGPATGSSMVYSPSQLDAVDDVDPVAEADVYLAYGRDLQAEEILKDALRSNPGRIAIHQKLLELFGKRRDLKSFENIATLAFKASNGEGPDWERIRELGLLIDAGNPLYLPGGQPRQANGTPSRPAPLDSANAVTDNGALRATQSSGFVDLDLDFSLDEEPAGAIQETTASAAETTPGTLDLKDHLAAEETEPNGNQEEAASADSDALDFALPDAPLTPSVAPPQVSASRNEPKRQPATGVDGGTPVAPDSSKAATPRAPDFDMLEFDLGSLSLDLEDSVAPPKVDRAADTHEDPLATKLALAKEFGAIGDKDGARALIEEVISEASGDIKLKAQRALSDL